MRQLSIIFLTFFTLSVMAQTRGNGKLYGYKQGIAPGIVQKTLNEDGTETTAAPRARANYRIYLVTSSRAYPSELWVNGEMYGVSVKRITKTPVEQVDSRVPSEPVTKILVPKTNQMVIELTPIPASGVKQGSKGKTLASANELVVVYRQNGKFYYLTLSKLAELDTASLQ